MFWFPRVYESPFLPLYSSLFRSIMSKNAHTWIKSALSLKSANHHPSFPHLSGSSYLKDHWTQTSITRMVVRKRLKLREDYPDVTQTGGEQRCWEHGADTLSEHGAVVIFPFVKKKPNTVILSAVKQGVPAWTWVCVQSTCLHCTRL